MKYLFFTLFAVGLFLSSSSFAQSIKDVRINEIQVYNTNGFRDEYGQADGWIELFNKGYGKVNIAGCVLKVRGEAYHIPKGNPATVMAARGYAVFYASGMSAKGPFHTNFTLNDTDFIELYDAEGNLIDRMQFNPAEMVEDVSYGWLEERNQIKKLVNLPATTPGSSNNTVESVPRSEIYRQADPSGIVLTTINMVVVTIALTLLFFTFKYMGNYHIKKAVQKIEKKKNNQIGNIKDMKVTKKEGVVTNDELAAIAIALFKYSEQLHDKEKMSLTINRASKVYSPWSSKIYGLRQFPK